MLINFICFSYYEMRCSFLVGSINQPMKMLRHIIFFFSFILMIYGEWFFLGSGSVCVDHYCQRINQSNLIAWLRKFIYHAFSSPFSSISCNHYSLDCCLQLCPPVDLFNYSSPGFVSLVYFLFCFVFGLFIYLFIFFFTVMFSLMGTISIGFGNLPPPSCLLGGCRTRRRSPMMPERIGSYRLNLVMIYRRLSSTPYSFRSRRT